MNKTDIEWVVNNDGTQGFTSNPIRGQCKHFGTPKCGKYCYAEAIRKRFKQPAERSWHPKELEAIERRKKPAIIFMGSMYDIFGAWVPAEWIYRILGTVKRCPQHKFILLTKNIRRYSDFVFTSNCYLGATITRQSDVRHLTNGIQFVSIEPLLEEIDLEEYYFAGIPSGLLEGIIIGAQTGTEAIRPKREWVEKILDQANYDGCKVFIKDNLYKIYPDLPKRRELIW